MHIAFTSPVNPGVWEVAASFAQGASGRWQISTGGATRPAWARSGRGLLDLDESNTLIAVPVRTSGPTFIAGNPTIGSTRSMSSRIPLVTTMCRLMANAS